MSFRLYYINGKGIEIPIHYFLASCIIESYIYSALMRVTKANIVSAMFFHFVYNLMIHVVAINPSSNNGSIFPFVFMIVFEAVVLALMLLCENRFHTDDIMRT